MTRCPCSSDISRICRAMLCLWWADLCPPSKICWGHHSESDLVWRQSQKLSLEGWPHGSVDVRLRPPEKTWKTFLLFKTSLVAQKVKRLPTTQETWVRSLSWEDLLEKEMATTSSLLAWRIPWTEEPGGLQSTGLQRIGHDWASSLPF